MRKLLLAVLVTAGFAASTLLLQDRLTNPQYLVAIDVELEAREVLGRSPEFVLLTPDGSIDDAKETFAHQDLAYSFTTSRIARSVGVRTFSEADRQRISEVSVRVGSQRSTVALTPSEDWEIRKEQDGRELWILKSPPRAEESLLRVLGSKYDLMNWPGDLKVLAAFVADRPFLLPVHGLLWVVALFLVFGQARVQRWMAPYLRESLLQDPRFLTTVLLLLAGLLRVYSLNSVSGFDEGTFLAIGDQLARGARLYVDVWDTKSPGLFAYYALVLSLSRNLIVIHLMDLLVLVATALGLALVAKKLLTKGGVGDVAWIPLATGVAYLLVSSVQEANYAITPEQLVVFFSTWGLLLVLRNSLPGLFGAGLLFGTVALCKYPAGLDFVAFGFLWLYLGWRHRDPWLRMLKGSLLAVSGGLVMLAAAAAFFLISNTWDAFWKDNIVYDLFTYAGKNDLAGIVGNLMLFLKTYWAFAILMVIGFVALLRHPAHTEWLAVVVAWGMSSLVAILMPAHGFVNYWFQLWGIAALLVPWALWLLFAMPRQVGWLVPLAAGVVTLAAVSKIQLDKPDWSHAVADLILQQAAPSDTLFVLNANAQAVYVLTNKSPPTRWVHGYGRPEAETARIMDSRPEFLVTAQDDAFTQKWAKAFDDYVLVGRVGPHHVFKAKSHG